MPELIVLCGVVGSGKSTLATQLVPLGYTRVNQDELGDRRACESMVRSALAAGKNVVLDRQNFDRAQRRVWVDIGNQFPEVSIRCLVMGTTPEECEQRLMKRRNHPTIHDSSLALELLEKFLDLWEEPQLAEGFDRLLLLPSLPLVINRNYLELLLAELEGSPSNVNKKPKKSNYVPPKVSGPKPGGGDGGASWRAAQSANASGGSAWNWQGNTLDLSKED